MTTAARVRPARKRRPSTSGGAAAFDEAYVYGRISESADFATARQVKACRQLADARGVPVTATYTDEGVSAYDGSEREEFDRMIRDAIAAANAGRRVLLIAWDLDRLVRRVAEVGRLIDLYENHGVPFVTVQGGVDLTSAAGKLIAYILTAVAEMESEHKAERLRLRFEQDRERGRPHWSFRPFGFELGGAHNVEEAPVLRTLYTRFVGGESLRSLALWLQGEGITQPERKAKDGTTVAKPFTAGALRYLLAADRNAGIYRSKVPGLEAEAFPADWEAIVPADVHAQACRLLAANATGQSTATVHLLSGLLVCDNCGGKMTAAPRSDKGSTYKCRKDAANGANGCGRAVAQGQADAIVTEWVLSWLSVRANRDAMEAALSSGTEVDEGALADVIATAAARRRELVAMTDPDVGLLTTADIAPELERIKARVEDARAQLSTARAASPVRRIVGDPRAVNLDPEAIRADWDGESIDARRAIIADLVEVRIKATAKAGRTFDRNRVHIIDRYGLPTAA